MGIRYLHTMVRVKDLETSIAFYKLSGAGGDAAL